MLLLPFYQIISLIPVSILAAALLEPASINHQTSPSLSLLPGAVNASVGKKLQIQCNAPLYGQKLKVPSCKKVFELIVKHDSQIKFAERASMVPHALNLPYRLQSNDGVCYLQIELTQGAPSGSASSTEFGQAGFTLLRQCVTQWGYGGIAWDIGGDNQLKVVMASYKPNVKCNEDPAPPWKSVVNIFANMEASKEKYVFGPQGSSGVEVDLPWTLETAEHRAVVVLESDGRSATSSWYEIWEAVNSIAYMCVRSREKLGGATKIGSLGNIRIEMFDLNPGMGQPVISLQNHSLLDSLNTSTIE